MAGKIKEFQKVIVDDADFKETIAGEHVFIEVHPSWCGSCDCVKPMLYRIALDKEDIKFCTAASDKIQALSKYNNTIKPIFLYYRRGTMKGQPIEGVDTPKIQKLCDNIE
mmetsp:Transcript_8232/g.13049  ORF Transcript_8232/g.13049 Transcript_8232/m.13049 type:complete len:110 (-) Transcript_8232:116-445(-)|eukprot:CAMPEP_0184320130 /NCGR_PEP_ID=MMETSP1049-20130417/112539_1 /TAXON_ID=77928 /ORGANISM="Proteomonas sulcata, Strain CCMP704" /LENGTH=109 /DNA_ID=CAMNT_0026640543 /DNA_START=211 /DNA_END=540 /DNA_ORIENTATION=+